MPVHISFQSSKFSYRVNRKTLQKRCQWLLNHLGQSHNHVSVVLMDDPAIAAYNEQYRHRKGPTNVLSFPANNDAHEPPHPDMALELGDILISLDTAAREAQQNDISIHRRLTELIIHGVLHLLGYDHERSEEEALTMWEKEQYLFGQMNHIRSNPMSHLAVNVDHVATVREARGINEPDPVTAAAICELAGAQGIVVHLREDRRHIQDRDVLLLRETVKTKLNLEMAASKELIDIAIDINPDMVTLVPEKRQELTTEGGLDVIGNEKKIRKTIAKLGKGGIPVSLFIDPDAAQVEAAFETGATFVELHTGRYCDATSAEERDMEFRLIEQAAELAYEAGLRVNAGHGLNYQNTSKIAALDTIEELSIGHSIISRAVFVGLDQAVREMLALIRPPFPTK